MLFILHQLADEVAGRFLVERLLGLGLLLPRQDGAASFDLDQSAKRRGNEFGRQVDIQASCKTSRNSTN